VAKKFVLLAKLLFLILTVSGGSSMLDALGSNIFEAFRERKVKKLNIFIYKISTFL